MTRNVQDFAVKETVLMEPLELIRLTSLMERTRGRSDLKIGLIDGPVVTRHRDLEGQRIHNVPATNGEACNDTSSAACQHGTFVAGILSAKRGSGAPAICPNCTLLVRPLFGETKVTNGLMPTATPRHLAEAIFECIGAGATVLNISSALAQPSSKSDPVLVEALDEAARRGVIVVVAAGNHSALGGTTITAHPWVIPVVGYDRGGRPMQQSNLGCSIGRRGLGAPGDRIASIGANGNPRTGSGSSAATPFVTGTIALLWSEFTTASATRVKAAVVQPHTRRTSVVPPLLDAEGAYQAMRR